MARLRHFRSEARKPRFQRSDTFIELQLANLIQLQPAYQLYDAVASVGCVFDIALTIAGIRGDCGPFQQGMGEPNIRKQ